MKKILILSAVVLLIVIAILGVWLTHRSSTPQTSGQPSVSFPSAGQQGTSTTSGSTDFTANPAVKADPNNQGYYFIGRAPTDAHQIGDEPYQITYIAETKYFNITLTQEPLGNSRQKAETYLMQLLGATKDQMCSLNYAVYAPNDVNNQYAGTNLGFSFCPGAIQLPY